MSMNFSTIVVSGNLTKDPETRVTSTGHTIVTLSIACNKKSRSANGEMTEKTAFIRAKVWGKMGELCAKHLVKGQGVLVQGELEQDRWEDKTTGAKREETFIGGFNVQVVFGPKPGGARGTDGEGPDREGPYVRPGAQTTAGRAAPSAYAAAPPAEDPGEVQSAEDLPF